VTPAAAVSAGLSPVRSIGGPAGVGCCAWGSLVFGTCVAVLGKAFHGIAADAGPNPGIPGGFAGPKPLTKYEQKTKGLPATASTINLNTTT